MLPMVSLLIYIGLSGKIALHQSRISRQLGLTPPMNNVESSIEDKGATASEKEAKTESERKESPENKTRLNLF